LSTASIVSPRFKAASRSSNSRSALLASTLARVVTFSGTTRTSIELNGASIARPSANGSFRPTGCCKVRVSISCAGIGMPVWRPASLDRRRSSSICAATSVSDRAAPFASTRMAARSRLTTETSASAAAAGGSTKRSPWPSENRRNGLNGGMSAA
jgi:hypothetical protein